jgi:hypothetical protein
LHLSHPTNLRGPKSKPASLCDGLSVLNRRTRAALPKPSCVRVPVSAAAASPLRACAVGWQCHSAGAGRALHRGRSVAVRLLPWRLGGERAGAWVRGSGPVAASSRSTGQGALGVLAAAGRGRLAGRQQPPGPCSRGSQPAAPSNKIDRSRVRNIITIQVYGFIPVQLYRFIPIESCNQIS